MDLVHDSQTFGIDDKFRAEIAEFQTERGLTIDTIVGRQTWGERTREIDQLKKALAKAQDDRADMREDRDRALDEIDALKEEAARSRSNKRGFRFEWVTFASGALIGAAIITGIVVGK